jgi:two-component system sensor histidine kinase EvgS
MHAAPGSSNPLAVIGESRSSRAVERLSGAALALVSLYVLMLAALVDRTLTGRSREETRHDARQAAVLLSSHITSPAQALSALHAPVADSTLTDARVFTRLVGEHAERLGDFRAVWAADSLGRVRFAAAPAGGAPALPDSGTLAALSAEALGASLLDVSPLVRASDGTYGFVLLEPVRVGRRVVGFAGGTLDSARLLRGVVAQLEHGEARLALLIGRDTVRLTGNAPASGRAGPIEQAPVIIPDGSHWLVLAEAPPSMPWRRVALWTVALGALALLAIALLYERAQARRIAERSQELERLSTELLRANRSKSEFLANVSHELRTPLNAIVGFADLLRDGVYGELAPRQAGPVDRIEASANHLRHLVDQILDLAKMAAGRLEVHAETIDLRAFALQVASDMESLIHEKGLTLSISVGASLPRVKTDPTHLRQILVNLIGNAVKFTPHGGITVRARLVDHGVRAAGTPGAPGAQLEQGVVIEGESDVPLRGVLDAKAVQVLARLLDRSPKPDGKWIALQVADTGIGIPAKDRERIFDEFEQVNAGPRGDSMRRGTGLGLSISRRLARLLGGDITLESEEGRGSAFTLWIPIEERSERADG